eukprot:4804058-Pyramimonas_sp.AAC.1
MSCLSTCTSALRVLLRMDSHDNSTSSSWVMPGCAPSSLLTSLCASDLRMGGFLQTPESLESFGAELLAT